MSIVSAYIPEIGEIVESDHATVEENIEWNMKKGKYRTKTKPKNKEC